MSGSEVLQFRVSLVGINPPVWRRIQVPATYTFWGFHVAIQDAMGWTDSHLHEFRVIDVTTECLVHIGIPDVERDGQVETLPGWEVRLRAYMHEHSPVLVYEYDFGDCWTHAVQLEAELPAERLTSYPTCLAGERKCPPEDCGGVRGYQEFLEAITEPDHPEHKAMVQWVGGPYDPEDFDPWQVDFDDPGERWKLVFGDADTG